MNSSGQMTNVKPQSHPLGKLHKGTVLAKKKEDRDSYKLGDIMVRIKEIIFYFNFFKFYFF
jgi:hypothetical protein